MRTMRSNLLKGAALGFFVLAGLATPAAAVASDGDAASNKVVWINPPGANPPEQVVPGKYTAPGGQK